MMIILCAFVIIITLNSYNAEHVLLPNIIDSLQYFIGSIDKPERFSNVSATFLTILRIIYSGLILTILVKKMSR